MSPSSKKKSQKDTQRDTYEVSGKVDGQAVIVQGPDARVDITQREATPSEIRRQAELADLVLLKRSISVKFENFKYLVDVEIEKGQNPYRFGQALGFHEAQLLSGRTDVLDILSSRWKGESYIFLAGNGGSGKTSFLQAGIFPKFVGSGDLPVLVSTAPSSLVTSINKQFVAEITETQYLSQVPLSTFLRHVTECLPQGKQVYLLIDRFEEFLGQPHEEMEAFKSEWLYCIANLPRVRWLFCIHLGFSHLLNFLRPEINPFKDLLVLPPLDRKTAREAILKPAEISGITIEEAVIEDILDHLGGANIDPAQLQTVSYLMAGGNEKLRVNWTMEDYDAVGRADGILSQALERLIGQLNRKDREIAWRVLASLIENREGSATMEWMENHLKPYRIAPDNLKRVLKLLDEIHLIDVKDGQYYLSVSSIRPRIRQWVDQQAALVQARKEAMSQLRQFRNSALRGLFGGAIGFAIFDQLIYTGYRPDISFGINFIVLMISIGGIPGFLLTLTLDLSIAAYRASGKWLKYLVGGTAGMLFFITGILLYIITIYAGKTLVDKLPSAILEGGVWGAVIGLGTTFAMSDVRRIWVSILSTSLISGFILLGFESISIVLANDAWEMPPSDMRIFLAGAIVPICYMTAALFRRPKLEDRDERGKS
jgi:hypothetical protein